MPPTPPSVRRRKKLRERLGRVPMRLTQPGTTGTAPTGSPAKRTDPLIAAGGKVLGEKRATTGPRKGQLYTQIEKNGSIFNVHYRKGKRQVFRVKGAPLARTGARARGRWRSP